MIWLSLRCEGMVWPVQVAVKRFEIDDRPRVPIRVGIVRPNAFVIFGIESRS
jgi:hypothetical protein